MASTIKNIDAAFLRKLKEFAKHGYAFDSDHSLRRGTRQDPDAKGTQREAFDFYVQGLEAGNRHGYFEIPTGVGKTALFTAIAKSFTDAVNGEKDGPRTLIVVPSEKLAVQTAKSFAKFMPEIAPLIETDDNEGKEIDWENSDIGLQYGKAKHAGRKPKVLITTYQSLNRDYENKIYPPKEYGMVIYDEGHAITAGQYGMAVDKFQNSLQLAVTATPEYSEEKTVAARLPHRYYGISIADAINRGDLCNVRPVLLKTNYTVNKEKFKQYIEKSRGKITDAQITALLNEQTRNRAAMVTYLLGADPDSGDRYLGQNAMIFCGTTDHVDDFTRQFHELINKQTYKPVKEWLAEEGIELIAPVHGKIKGAYLKKGMLGATSAHIAKYEGNKEWYSEEEIFDLHAKGKILLLASVKKLKEGYDSPRDSIIIDTVDRLSKVDATQIVGRGFRLHPPNEEYNDPGDPDKTCTVINMVDKNTHELYADKPQMLPIYCAEVIEGAEFRTPRKRKHLIQKFAKEPPEVNTTLEASGFKLETNIEVVREESRKNKKKRENAILPDKTEEWLSSKDIEDLPGGYRGPIQKITEKIRSLYDIEKSKIQEIELNKQSIRVQRMQAGAQQPVCIYKDDWAKVEKAAGVEPVEILPEKDSSWIGKSDITSLPGGSRKPVTTVVDYLINSYDHKKLGIQKIEYNKQVIRVQKMHASGKQTVYIYKEDWPKVQKAAGEEVWQQVPEHDAAWLTDQDRIKLPGASRGPIVKAVDHIIDTYDSEKSGIQKIKYNSQSIRVQKMRAGVRQTICIYKEDWPKLEKAAGVETLQELPNKDANWLGKQDTLALPGGASKYVIQTIKGLINLYDIEESGIQTIDYNEQKIRLQQVKAGGIRPVCIFRDDWDKVKEAASVLSQKDNDLKSKSITPRKSPAHQTTEERTNAKRGSPRRD